IEFKVPLIASKPIAQPAPADITINYQACNDHECLRPTSIKTRVDLASPTLVSGSAPAPIAAEPQPGADLASVFANRGSVLGFLLVFLGGLALNLTPCVYPMVGVTIAYFGRQGGGHRRVLVLALFYFVGIAVTFSAVGVAA